MQMILHHYHVFFNYYLTNSFILPALCWVDVVLLPIICLFAQYKTENLEIQRKILVKTWGKNHTVKANVQAEPEKKSHFMT